MSAVTVFAPATVANVGVGFDVLGFAFDGAGDRVTVERVDGFGVEIVALTGVGSDELPVDAERNTATVALRAMIADLGLGCGFRVSIDKGIPIGSGMGGSAASAVGAVVAAAALLEAPPSRERLLGYAVAGEAAASGEGHADNAAPCLVGGLCGVLPGQPPRVVPLAVPAVLCVLVHPDLRGDTRGARRALRETVQLEDHVQQTAWLLGFVTACFRGDHDLLRHSFRDVVIGPQRASAVPGYVRVREAALGAGALGCALAGSGPSLFAWTEVDESVQAVGDAMVAAFEGAGLPSRAWQGPIASQGARIVP